MNKSKWQEGEWKYEPDKKLWIDKLTGYFFYIKRTKCTGALCGYVGVDSTHPLFNVDYESDNFDDYIDVHGGVTFTGTIDLEISSKKSIWWIGFDCAHCGDEMPNLFQNLHIDHESTTYKNIEYVTSQLELLAKQLKNIEMTENTEIKD